MLLMPSSLRRSRRWLRGFTLRQRESDEAAGGEMRSECGWRVELVGGFDCRIEVLAAAKRREKTPRRFLQTIDFDAVLTALDQQEYRPGGKVESGERRLVAVEYGPPDGVGAIVRAHEADRSTRAERD